MRRRKCDVCSNMQQGCVHAEISCQRTSYSAKLRGGTLLTPWIFSQHGHPYTSLHHHHTLSYSTSTPPLNAIIYICYTTAPQLRYRIPYYSTITRDLKNTMDYVWFCHLLKTLHCCLCPSGRCSPPRATHPSPSIPSAKPLLGTICHIMVTVKKWLKFLQCYLRSWKK